MADTLFSLALGFLQNTKKDSTTNFFFVNPVEVLWKLLSHNEDLRTTLVLSFWFLYSELRSNVALSMFLSTCLFPSRWVRDRRQFLLLILSKFKWITAIKFYSPWSHQIFPWNHQKTIGFLMFSGVLKLINLLKFAKY